MQLAGVEETTQLCLGGAAARRRVVAAADRSTRVGERPAGVAFSFRFAQPMLRIDSISDCTKRAADCFFSLSMPSSLAPSKAVKVPITPTTRTTMATSASIRVVPSSRLIIIPREVEVPQESRITEHDAVDVTGRRATAGRKYYLDAHDARADAVGDVGEDWLRRGAVDEPLDHDLAVGDAPPTGP